MNRKLSILSFIINIPTGVLLFIFAGIDDSPGGQLIGALVSVVGVVGLISILKK